MRRPPSGFTLVEVLLVLAIMAIVTVIAMPTLVHSIRGNRLRTAARTVTMAGRYARSMALLQQREMVLAFNLDKSALTVGPAGAGGPAAETTDASVPDLGAEPVSGSSASGVVVRADAEAITRSLDQVTMESVTIGDSDVADGSCQVVYRSNGLCTPYKVTISDMYGSAVIVDVDALGSAVTTDR
jgi:prepilin-type N-terminal cleavage/methylation domain-containing protein